MNNKKINPSAFFTRSLVQFYWTRESEKRFAPIFFALFALIFFSKCAQIVMPNGGAKDEKPPRAIKYLPDSAATNFKSKEINIVFNEYIQLKDVNNQLIVSPLLDEQPEIKLIKNHILNIEFKKPLKENTTYTMNFGNSIADYNEGNAIDNFQYVFSTGAFIDSLSLSGKVQYAFDHKMEKGVWIMLYDATTYADSTPYKKTPLYFGKTKADGTYKINNIRAGKYKVFALKDENNNYKYNESEVIGFVDQEIEINKNTSLDVELFKETPKKLKLIKTSVVGYGHIVFVFNKPTEYLAIKVLNIQKIPSELKVFSKQEDSLEYWFDGVTADSLKFQLLENNKPFDTVDVRLMTKEQAKKFEKGKFKLIITSNVVPGQKFDLDKYVQIKFNHPVINHSMNKIIFKPEVFPKDFVVACCEGEPRYYQYLLETPIRLSGEHLQVNTDPKTHVKDTIYVAVSQMPIEKEKDTLLVLPGAFTDMFGLQNDTFKVAFQAQEEKFYGTIKLKLDLSTKGNYVLQFLDARENIVKEELVNESKTLNYETLQPGAYKLKLILDANKDGKWSAGNYLEKTQAEKVIYYDKPITIRSNWDLELEWKINSSE